MKQKTTNRRSRFLLLTLLAFLLGGASPIFADTLTEDFNGSLPTGWSLVGDLSKNSDRARSGSGVWTSSQSDNANYLVIEEVEGSLTFYARAYNKSKNSYVRVYAYTGSALGDELAATTNMYTSSTPSWGSKTLSLGDYKGQVAIALNYACIDDLTYTQKEAIDGPALTIKDGSTKITSPYAYNFGLTTAGTTKVFTLTNPGTAAVEGLSIDKTGDFGATLSATSIAASGQATLTVTMPEATGNSAITISSTTEGIDDFVINASGTIRDLNKVYLDFSDGKMPEGWTSIQTGSNSSYPWTATDDYIYTRGTSDGYKHALTSPKLTFEKDEVVMFKSARYNDKNWSGTPYVPSIIVEYSLDGSSWTAIGSAFTDDAYGAWTQRSVTIPVDGVQYIRFNGYNICLTEIYGGELPDEPKMVVTEPATLNFGLYDKDDSPAPTKTFTIANTGKATLNGISVTSGNAAFTITNAPSSLAAGASQTVTITMATGTTGALSSLITVSATDMEDATFTVTGCVKPAGMPVEDFSEGLPANWTNASWTFADGEATGKSMSAYLTTPKLTIAAGDFFIIKAKRYDNDASDYLTVQGSNDNGSTWTAYNKKLQNADGLTYPDYGTIVLSDIPTTVNKIRFVGYYAIIDEIHGLTYAPSLSVTKDAAAVNTPANYDFGECAANANVTYNFANAGGGTINITNVAITGEGAAAYSTNWTESTAAPFDLTITRSYDAGRGGEAQAAVVTVTTSEGNFVINVTGTDKGANDPEFAVLIGEAEQTTGANLGFGTITANTVKTFKIQNAGTGALNITAVTMPDADYTTDLEYAPSALSPLVIAAGTTKTINITLAASAKAIKSDKNIVISAEGFEDFTFVADATVMPGATIIDFNSNALPDGWTNNASNKWSFSDGKAYCTAQSSSPAELVTKKLQFVADDFITVSATSYDDYDNNFIEVLGSTDNGETWTAFDAKKYISKSQIPYGSYATIVVDEIPATVNKLKFRGYYVRIDEIAGLVYDENDPAISVFSDAEATQAVASATTKDFGWAQGALNATYYIKNGGTGTLTISDIDVPAGFTAATAGDVMTVAADADPLALTITMSAGEVGAKSGTITLTTDGGNFTIPVMGFIYGSKNLVDFTNASQYTGWTGVNVTDNVAALSSTAIQTTKFAADAAEKLYVEIKGSSAYASKSFSYSYSRDNGETWSDAFALVESTYSSVADQVFTITNIADAEAESTVLIRFTGAGLGINRIYGFEAVATPVMSIDKTADYNFGMQTAAAEYVITVTNSGTANLTNLAATLTTGTDYSVVVSKTTVPYTGENTATITVTQLFDAANGLASFSDELTISADDVDDVVINLSGQTRDGSKWYVDFASGIPSSFIEKGSWNGTSQQASILGESSLKSQTLTIAANEKIQFDVKKQSFGIFTFKVRHSLNGGISWSDYTDLTSEEGLNSSTFTTLEYGCGNTDASVDAMIEFLGSYAYLDNIYGGTLNNELPIIQVKKSTTIVNNGVVEAFGVILDEATATYTIKNVGNGTLTITSPVATTGVATAAVDETSLAAGESATLTITMPVESPYGEKDGAVTVETNLGNFVINYTATTMDPNALNVDFSDNTLPAGWYKESGWYNYNQVIYRSDRNSDQYFMTQKLTVAGTDDVLKFDAKKYSSTYASSTVLKVSYSTDRVNWTEIDSYASEMTTSFKTFEISGLAAGQYYLKFEGRYASIDNIIGWKKVAGIEHDLYVTTSTFPATTDKGESATISATVTSLRADETEVYAKLFINGVQEGDAAAAQDIALKGTKTFSFTYAIPENKTAQIKVYFSDDSEAFATAENAMKVNYTLDQTVDNSTITAGTFNVTLERTFIEGWNTVCLPFAIADIEEFFGTGAYAYSFSSFNAGEITFAKQDEMTAATPYLVYVPEAIASKNLTNVTVSDAAAGNVEQGGVTFQGTYAPVAAGGDLTGKYVLTPEAKIAKAGNSATMNGFRAYFVIPAETPVKALVFDDGTATGIEIIDVTAEPARDIFDLAGRKLNEVRKGVNIVNGKKILKK